MDYETQIHQRFWAYRDNEFSGLEEHFDRQAKNAKRPPVFSKSFLANNLLVPPSADDAYRQELFEMMPSPSASALVRQHEEQPGACPKRFSETCS